MSQNPPKSNVIPYLFDKGDLMRAFSRAVKFESPGCTECGNDRDKSSLEFHHRNPAEKVASIGSMIRQPTRYNITDLMNEVAKCDLVCEPCHKDIHRKWRVVTGHSNQNPLFLLENDK
jgi:5-methylcytosine-specific restriction endonuclease McrA